MEPLAHGDVQPIRAMGLLRFSYITAHDSPKIYHHSPTLESLGAEPEKDRFSSFSIFSIYGRKIEFDSTSGEMAVYDTNKAILAKGVPTVSKELITEATQAFFKRKYELDEGFEFTTLSITTKIKITHEALLDSNEVIDSSLTQKSKRKFMGHYQVDPIEPSEFNLFDSYIFNVSFDLKSSDSRSIHFDHEKQRLTIIKKGIPPQIGHALYSRHYTKKDTVIHHLKLVGDELVQMVEIESDMENLSNVKPEDLTVYLSQSNPRVLFGRKKVFSPISSFRLLKEASHSKHLCSRIL